MKSILLAVILSLALPTIAYSADYKVMIVTWSGCEEACQGFQDYLNEQGYDIEYITRNAGRDHASLPGYREEARTQEVDLVLTWGTSVSRGVSGTLDDLDDPTFNHHIPHVFTVVADPVGARIVASLDRTDRKNVAGTFNRVPERVNIETIKTYDPDFNHLGLLYNVNEENSVLKKIELDALSAEMGFDFTAIELPVGANGKPNTGDIAPAVAQLRIEGVDFIYLGSSSFLDVHRDIFTTAAVDNGLPVLSPYERLVTGSNALISIAARYYDTGRLAGALAENILIHGAAPGDLPVARMTDFSFVINMDVARKLGMFPPLDLLRIAETVNN